jgi:hypothetical protein
MLDQRQRGGVTFPFQEVLTREALIMIESKRELMRPGGAHHTDQSGSTPV